ncbi:PAS domain-containing sensor histidine kinase [Exiguobacterium flavidum]|uniref:PAS domain-containing sensor histidine kinase n=1 Tax=Exiguobacterium flavidum TaxID=2184695 RepID=UPI0018E568E1|nr:PAS domain-containing sensor histidine kinase [Exiguobacterium flavidum]
MDIEQFGQQILSIMQDGVIVMDHTRKIVALNPSAEQLTGWRLGNAVPYCSYCQNRIVEPGQERCYLIKHERSPYFSSEMPTYSGMMVDVEMSTARILNDTKNGMTYYLLVLRDFSERKRQQEHELRQKMVRQLIAAREDEHKRLARELHDGVGQSLFGISLALDALRKTSADEKTTRYLDQVTDELKRVMTDLRLYSKQLRPLELDQFGLMTALENLLANFRKQRPSIRFILEAEEIERSDGAQEINLYRIVQEAVTNSLKYAQPEQIIVTLSESDGRLLLTIEDDGIGFDVNRHENGLGIQHMMERAKSIGGVLSLDSRRGQGTRIIVQVNQEEKEGEDEGGTNQTADRR